MKRFWYRFALAIGIAIGATTFGADVKPYSSMQELKSGSSRFLASDVYRVSSTCTFDRTSNTGVDGLTVNADSTAVIYIPRGVTLTVLGSHAKKPEDTVDSTKSDGEKRVGLAYSVSPGYWAGAGIYVPEGATLIVTGEGTLIAKGGNAANGMKGFQGWDEPELDDYIRTGGGGQGGWGGGGAGAAIGGRGGNGGKRGEMVDTNNAEWVGDKNFETCTAANNNRDGNPGGDGEDGKNMGSVYILGTVKVQAFGGVAGEKGGEGGPHSGYKKEDEWAYYDGGDDWFAGPGGGGGGGGAGCGVSFSIGGGAGGGGGGGGGATGSFVVVDNWDASRFGYNSFDDFFIGGHGGKGGIGPANITGSNGKDGNRAGKEAIQKKSGDKGGDVSCHAGGSGGTAGEPGKNGKLFISSTATVESGLTNQQAYATFTIPTSGFECIQYKLTFVITGERSETLKQTLGCAYPAKRSPPSRDGYKFRGYFSERNGAGEMWYDASGELKHEGVCSKCGDLTLYASWALDGSSEKIVVKEGQTLEFDGLIDTKTALFQPESGNLFTVEPGGKLVLKNVTVQGSDLGHDSVIKNFGEVFVTNCVFQENFSPYGAGAVYRDKPGAKAVFYGCSFKGNSALEGGVISAEGSTVSVIYSSFFDNFTTLQTFEKLKASDAETKGNHEGAAILGIDNAKINLISCTFYNNYCWNDEWPYASAVSLSNTAATPIVCKNNLIAGYATLNYGFIRGENYSTKDSDDNNLCKKDRTDILGDEIRREINHAKHYARRPLPMARTGGDSGKLYTSEDYSVFSHSQSSSTPNFLAADQFGQHPIDGWYGAITGNTLQYLINNTPVGGTLVVPSGRYDPVEVNKTITIIGEDRDETYIDADMLEPCFVLLPGSENMSISNFGFLFGKGENGGAITAPETGGGYVTNCVFSSCKAVNGGAVAFLKTASQCIFSECLASNNGGGTYKCDLVDRSYYLKCIAEEAGGGASEDTIVRASLFSRNIAKKGGGGNDSKFYNCTFDRNEASAAESSQGAIYGSWITGCVLYGSQLPSATSMDAVTVDNVRASAEYKADKFYDAPNDLHLRLRNYNADTNTRTPVDHSSICVSKLDTMTLATAEKENWLDIEGNPLVSVHSLTGEKFLYGGCYAFAPFKISGTVVTGTEEWYDNTNAKTSLREAIDAALTDPAYATNEVATVTFSKDLVPEEGEDFIILTLDESQIEVSAFTNRTLVIQGPTDKVIAINGNQKYRAFRVLPHNNLKVENILFQNCLGSEYGTNPQASSHGGAILNYGNLSVSNCVFAANSSGTRKDFNNQDYPVGYGGAIATMTTGTNSASTVIRNSTFAYNKAQRGGAIYADKNSTTDIFFSTFGENVAIGSGATEAAGGAIAMDLTNTATNSVVTLVNCTLVGNSVPDKVNAGGAINTRSGLVLLDSIVLGNTSGGITNDVAMSGGSITGKANARMISSAIGKRTDESVTVDYSDEVLYKVDNLENFLSTTNAVSAETVLPHIIYPTSTKLKETALLSKYASDELFGYDARNNSGYTVTTNTYINVHEEEVTTYTTNYTFRAEAIRGLSRELNRNGKAFEVDQIGEAIDGNAIFGSTVKTADPRINERIGESTEETEEGTDDDPLKGVKVIIIDYLGTTNTFATASEAIQAYKYGDTIKAVNAEDGETLDALDNAFYQSMYDFAVSHDWYDFIYSDDYTTYAMVLNEKAKPIITAAPEIDYSPTEVAMRTVENMKPGLWYALGRSDSPAGPFEATNWQEGKGPNSFNEMYFDKPLTAPKTSNSGFYRVIVAPYCPLGEVIR